jgi:alpha-galactosidase
MNRRIFLRTTGTSLAAVLIARSRLAGAPAPGEDVIGFPYNVYVRSGGRMISMKSSDGSGWSGEGIYVKVSDTGKALAVEVMSAPAGLSSITLAWGYDGKIDTKYLGDHWERSYGDLSWGNGKTTMPWYFLEYDGKVTNGFGVKTGCPTFCSWELGDGELRLTMDVRSGGADVQLRQRQILLAEIVVYRGTENERPLISAEKFCRLMCAKPRLPQQPVYGTNDWYYTYGKNSEKVILENCAALSPLADGNENRPFAVVDAGWAVRKSQPDLTSWGDDFTLANENFPDMAALARKIRESGMRPGIWVRPLCANPRDGESLLIPGTRFFDPTIPENLARVGRYFRTYNEWGYDLVKFDFTTFDILGKWGFQMADGVIDPNRRFHDSLKTNAEIILNLYRTIREAAGDTYVLACNTVSHLSAGLFELCRIGDDTSGLEWDRTRKMGVNALGFRICQHNAFYAADGDCVGLTLKVPWEKNRQWMRLLAGSGTPLFVSAQLEAMGSVQKAAVKESFRAASEPKPTGEPLDWLTNAFPARWILDGRTVEFNWKL